MVKKNPLIRGVTLSGGEPFSQAAEHAELAKLLHENGYEVAAYSGYTFEQLMADPERRALLELLDVLVDGRFIEAQKDYRLRFKGSRNQRIIDVPASLREGHVVCSSYDDVNQDLE